MPAKRRGEIMPILSEPGESTVLPIQRALETVGGNKGGKVRNLFIFFIKKLELERPFYEVQIDDHVENTTMPYMFIIYSCLS